MIQLKSLEWFVFNTEQAFTASEPDNVGLPVIKNPVVTGFFTTDSLELLAFFGQLDF